MAWIFESPDGIRLQALGRGSRHAWSPDRALWRSGFSPSLVQAWPGPRSCRCSRPPSAFGTLFDIGHATGPILAGVLIGATGGQDFRAAFAAVAGLLIATAVVFAIGVGPRELQRRTR